MSNQEILGGKWTLDTTDLKAGISEANRLIRVADSEFKAVAASMGQWGNQADGLSAKIKSLTTIVDVQEQKVQALKEQHQNIVSTSGAHSKAAQELEIQINKETASLNRNKLELQESKVAYQNIIDKTQETAQKKEELKKKTEQLTASINEMGKKAMVTLTAAAAAASAALGKLMIDSGKFADDLITLSNKTGISVTQLQEMSYAARFVDVSVETMTSSMNKLTRTMESAQSAMQSGKLNDQAKAYQRLGIEVTHLDGSLRNNKDVYYETIDALGQMSNETERDALAMQLFGKSATELNPLIKAGSKEFERLAQEAHSVGAVVSEDGVSALGAFDDTMQTLNASTQGLMREALAQLAPLINELLVNLKDMMPQIVDTIQNFITFVIDNGPLIASLIAAIGTGLLAWNVVTMVQGLITVIKGWKLATEGMTLSQALLNIVMSANPIGIIITLIAALVGGLIVLWNTNEDFRKAVTKIFNDILSTISNVVNSIVTFFTVTIPKSLSDVGKWFSDIGTNIVKGIWSGIQGMGQWFSDQVGKFFNGIVSGAKKLLGIQSPSKVFAGIGENMAQGLGLGFQDEIQTMQSQIQEAIPIPTMNSVSGHQGTSPSSAGGASIIIHQHIQSPKALSAFEVYRQTKHAGQLIAATLK
jgi:uncharacterized membrane protein